MKKIKFLSIILLVLLFALPVLGRDFGQEKNNFEGVQYFEGGVIFGTEADSLDTLTYVSNDTTLADADPKALVTEYAVEKAINSKQPYKVYMALLTQLSTSHPVATVFYNTIGDISWVREYTGYFKGELDDAFTMDKTFTNLDNWVYVSHPAGDNFLIKMNAASLHFVEIHFQDGDEGYVDGFGKLFVVIYVFD